MGGVVSAIYNPVPILRREEEGVGRRHVVDFSTHRNDQHFDRGEAAASTRDCVNLDYHINLDRHKRQNKRKGTHDMTSSDWMSELDYDGDASHKKTKKSSGDHRPRLACPYHRRNPSEATSRSCRGDGYLAISRLKEHLYRCHRLSLDVPAQVDGEDATKRAVLKKKTFPREKTDLQLAWSEVWLLLFPDDDSSICPSAFIGTGHPPCSKDKTSTETSDTVSFGEPNAVTEAQSTVQDATGLAWNCLDEENPPPPVDRRVFDRFMLSMDSVASLEKHTIGTLPHFVTFCALELDNLSTEWVSRKGQCSQTFVVGRQDFEEVWSSITSQAFTRYQQRFAWELNDGGNVDAARQAREHVERTTDEATRTDGSLDQVLSGLADDNWDFGSSISSAAHQQSSAIETTLFSGNHLDEFWKWSIDQSGEDHMELDVGGQNIELD